MKHPTFLLALLCCFSSISISAQDYIMGNSGSGVLTDCAGTIYDSGGPDGDYSNNDSFVLTIDPPGDGPVTLIFNHFDLEDSGTGCFDEFNIYDGAENDPLNLIPTNPEAGFCWDLTDNNGTFNLNGETIISTGGAITIEFIADGSVERSGFEIDFFCFDPNNPIAIVDISTPNAGSETNSCDGNFVFETTVFGENDPVDPLVYTYSWDFGDGNVSAEANPTHTYNVEGDYTVSLELCNQYACNDIEIPSLTYDSESLSCFELIMPTSGGSETYTGCNAILYDSGGPDGSQNSDDFGTYIIHANEPNSIISLDIDIETTDGSEYEMTILDGEVPNADILAVFETGSLTSSVFSTSGTVTIIYSTLGFTVDYEIIINCIDLESAPTAAIETISTNSSLTCDGSVTVSNTEYESDTWTMTYNWDFGDGNNSTEANPTHTYDTEGDYDITLETCNQYGCSEIVSTTITYDSLNVACFDLTMPISGNAFAIGCSYSLTIPAGGPTLGSSYTIYADEPNSVLMIAAPEEVQNFSITILDGPNTSSSELEISNTSSTYITTGDVVTIEQFSNFSLPTDVEIVISCLNIETDPEADLTENQTLSCDGVFDFSNNGYEAQAWDLTYSWDFGDGNTSMDTDPVHTYDAEGIYTVNLELCNQYGCSNTSQIAVFDSLDNYCFENLFPSEGIDTLTVCNGFLFDSGGPDGNYGLNESGVLVLQNPTPNGIMTLTFSELNLENGFDLLTIYDGPNTNSSVIFSSESDDGLPNNGEPIFATGNSLTIEFTSDPFFATTGWEASFNCLNFDYTATAYAFYDENENGVLDGDEYFLYEQPFNLEPGGGFSFPNSEGQSFFSLSPNQEYTLSYENDSPLWSVNGSSVFDFSTAGVEEFNEIFAVPLIPNANITTNELDISSSFVRCNQEISYWLSYTNNGTTTNSGFVELVVPENVEFVSAIPAADSVSGDNYYWYYEELLPSYGGQVQALLLMPDFTFMGDDIYVEGNIENWNGSGDSKDFTVSELACAYDPNDKLVEPSGYGEENFTLLNDTLDYTIRFQNTGNDTALNIFILDTLSTFLDINTFRVLASSHEVRTEIATEERIVSFYFDDIYLVDSFANEPASHGFIKYRIFANEDLGENAQIENTAGIYFDFNPAVVTNTVSNQMVSVLPVLPILGASPSLLDFESVEVEEAAFLEVDIQNSGELPLEVLSYSFDNDAFSTNAEPMIVEGGGNQAITVQFAPQIFGESNAVLTIETNVGTIEIDLTGYSGEVGINTLFHDQLSLFPNPNNGQFYLQSKTNNRIDAINVYDNTGRVVYTSEESNGASVKIDLTGMSSGVYFIEVQTKEATLVEKVVVK